MAASKPDLTFFRNLVRRQIRQDYLENLTGFAWLILQPLILLAVYAFVFTYIFKSRLPDSELGFVPYLAVAFWPWTAFSESILKASGAITANAALIGKVALATEQLPLATVTATFIMNSVGYIAVLIVLQLMGTDIHWAFIAALIPVLILLWVFACAIALFTSALQVFVKDVAQILPPLMTFWFFTTPIIYSLSQFPERIAEVMSWNPMAWFVEKLRNIVLYGDLDPGKADLAVIAGVGLLAWLALRFFRRFSDHFEDFL
jgi:ABC-type polysaccharide/polyol phosphate export permease